MNLNEIKNEALHLPEGDRADLAQELLISLDLPTQDEIADDWLIEAQQRAKDLDSGLLQPIPAEEVRQKAQALLR
ncbi:MAG: addiction module protein [Mariprofundaceae bacterium]|nr:addiction module protein [Mariprofundaceae bacterium]